MSAVTAMPSVASSPAALTVADLRTGFGANTVLHGVEFTVGEGEIVAILGLNGAGKSVTMKTIAGVVPTWAGDVTLFGSPITHLGIEDRVARGIAHVTQGRQVFPELTVEENIRLGGYLMRRKDKGRYTRNVLALYERFPRLGERRHQAAGTLSGGEQAMLALARALVSEPRLMLIDEPTAGLAPVIVDEIADALRAVKRDGVTILLVEQHVPFALGLADKALIMQRGTIVYEEAVGDIDHETMVQALGIGRLLTVPAAKAPVAAKPHKKAALRKRIASQKAAVKKAPATKKGAATMRVAPKKPVAKKPVAKKTVAKKPAAKKRAER